MRFSDIKYFDENFELKQGSIDFEKTIKLIAPPTEKDEFSDCILVPGFVDIHTHGGNGVDWCDCENYDVLSAYYAKNGVTSVCPTTMTLPLDTLCKIAAAVESFKSKENGAYIHGINLEGPFVSAKKCGAQNKDFLALPSIDWYNKISGITRLSLVDVAPELEGATEFSRAVSKTSVVSVAHTDASYEITKSAFENGFSHVTHLFNAMSGFNHRAPGVVGAVFESEECSAELICDGFHVAPSVVKTTFKILGEDRVCVISDSLKCAGLDDCSFEFGGQTVYLKNGEARLSDGTIAGSTSNIYAEFKNLLSFGLDFKTALKACTINPARVIKVDDVCGSIKENKNADFVLLDENNNICHVFIKGKQIF